MSDLVKHLRAGAADGAHPLTLLLEAADEIRRLTVQNERLCAKFEQLRAQLNELGYRHPPLIFDDAAIAEMKAHEAHYQKQWADRMKEVSDIYVERGEK